MKNHIDRVPQWNATMHNYSSSILGISFCVNCNCVVFKNNEMCLKVALLRMTLIKINVGSFSSILKCGILKHGDWGKHSALNYNFAVIIETDECNHDSDFLQTLIRQCMPVLNISCMKRVLIQHAWITWNCWYKVVDRVRDQKECRHCRLFGCRYFTLQLSSGI